MTGCVFIYLNNICDLKCDYIDMLMYVQECVFGAGLFRISHHLRPHCLCLVQRVLPPHAKFKMR